MPLALLHRCPPPSQHPCTALPCTAVALLALLPPSPRDTHSHTAACRARAAGRRRTL
jgi:hypothetical protein